jgi:metal-responsive CopG/Arc/MetJ family transcriptional regulator
MAKKTLCKVTVLLSDAEFERLDNFCRDRGFKKSTLIARLVRQYLDMEGYGAQRDPNRNPFGRGTGSR